MQVKEIMSKNLITVGRDIAITDVAKILRSHKIHGVPVVEGKHLIGIITETDFFAKGDVEVYLPTYLDVLEKTGFNNDKENESNRILQAKAEDIMTVDCITVSPEDDIKKLISIIRENDLHTVPVVIGDIVMGIVTVADVIKLL